MNTRLRFASIAFTLLALGAWFLLRAGDGTGELARGEFARGESVPPIPLPYHNGEYIEGEIDSGGARVHVDLVDARGSHLRRLIADGSEISAFRFVADTASSAFRVSPVSGGGTYKLSLKRIVKTENQLAPAPRILSTTLSALAGHIAKGGDTDAFWKDMAAKGTPLVERWGEGRVLLTFVWRGARKNVRLVGALAPENEWLTRLGQSDVWYTSFDVPDTARLQYRFAPDVPDFEAEERERRQAQSATIQVDPLNKHPWPRDAIDAYAQSSNVVLPKTPPQPWSEAGKSPKGTLTRFRIASATLANEREITLYRPAAFDARDARTLILIAFDATEYLGVMDTPTILDNLIAAGRIPPTVAAFVSSPDKFARNRELPGNPKFSSFLANELLPRIERETGLSSTPPKTVLAGSSYGGLASTTTALSHPDRFGNVLSMSGSFWWAPENTPPDREEYVAGQIARLEPLPIRFYLSAGTFETARGGKFGILETNRHLRDVLEAKGYFVVHQEYAAGHDYAFWRGSLADGLLALFDLKPARAN